MHFEFFKQRIKACISAGDEIALYADRNDDLQSGRYTVAQLLGNDSGVLLATLVGMGPLAGTVCEVDIGDSPVGGV